MATFTKIDYQGNSFVASFNLTSTPGVAAGHLVLVAFVTTLGSTMTFSDSAGNSYAVDKYVHETSSGHWVGLASAFMTNPIGAGGTIAMAGGSSDAMSMIGYDVAPTAGYTFALGSLDQTASADSASSATLAAGTTGTLAQAVEIAFVAFEVAARAPTFTAGGSFTKLDENWFGAWNQGLMTEWMETAATTALSPTGTLTSGADSSAGAVATYKETAAASGPPPLALIHGYGAMGC